MASARVRSVFGAGLCLALAGAVLADGSDPTGLGAPSIAVSGGTHIVAAGAGMETQPGLITVSIPAGATINQVLLYWSGFDSTSGGGDSTIIVNGVSVNGTLIGGPTLFFSVPRPFWATSYRADITALSAANNWVVPGTNNLTVDGLSYAEENDGAGILVIYDDGSDPSQIDLRDGSDLAFNSFAPPLNAVVPQTFNFASAPYDRQADLILFVGSVDENRSSRVQVTSGGNVQNFDDLLGNTDGPMWDTVSGSITVPANATDITFEIISGPPGGPLQPASLDWINCSFAVLPPPINGTIIIIAETIPPGGTGFTFTDDIRPPNGFMLDDGQNETFLEVPPGTYVVDEDDPTVNPGGWTLTNLVCVDSDNTGVDSTIDLSSGRSTINLEAGETVVCTYTHVPETGTIIIEKDTIPAGGTGFDFTDNVAAPNAFSLDDGGTKTFTNVDAGSYSVVESLPPGWEVSNLVCIDSDPAGTASIGNAATGTSSINLDPGETVRCTYTNSELPGTIVIAKTTVPPGGTGFGFSDNIGAPLNFSLNDGQTRTFVNVPAGSYSVQEAEPQITPGGYDLTQLTCTDSVPGGTASTTDVATRTASINLDPGETVRCTFVNSEPEDCRFSASEKGSLLVYSKVDIRWDAAGRLIQDTFIDIANDYPADVCVQMYYINGDEPLDAITTNSVVLERAHPGWNNVDVQICLTSHQPMYWSAATGQPAGIPSFTILDPGNPPGRPVPGTTDRMLRGYIVAFAVNSIGEEIRWNHLKGDAAIVDYRDAAAWEYPAWSTRAINTANGSATGTPGTLNLDGTEYCPPYETLLLDFYAIGSSAFSKDTMPVTMDTDLTLYPVSVDLRQETEGPVTTKASFTIWNMNEVKFTGLDQCITCWDQRLLSEYGIPNHFFRNNLQTQKGKARIDGLASQLCDFDYDPGDVCTQNALAGGTLSGADPNCDPRDVLSTKEALLGVAAKWITFYPNTASENFETAGMNLIGMGKENAVIYVDLLGDTPPERPVRPAQPIGQTSTVIRKSDSSASPRR
ncbi:MAG: hypothetical protein H6817_08655 [Phycisphaerales bacterium]|nr:hypothetical protein [Phycisphaerales bacterium]